MAAVARFNADGEWHDTLVCAERVGAALREVDAVHGQGGHAAATVSGRQLLQPEGDAALYYLATADGWLGVLCEAEEWLAVPLALPVLAPEQAPAGLLPSQDDFIERLLAMMGEEAE